MRDKRAGNAIAVFEKSFFCVSWEEDGKQGSRSVNCITIEHLCNDDAVLNSDSLCQQLKLKGVPFRKQNIVSLCDKVRNCMRPEWSAFLTKKDVRLQHAPVKFSVCQGQTRKDVSTVKTKEWYSFLKCNVVKVPTAEGVWSTLFLQYRVNTIWKNIIVPFASPVMFHMDFKLRHRRIYTGEILHQMNKTCKSVCNTDDENLEHCFLYCDSLQSFKTVLNKLL